MESKLSKLFQLKEWLTIAEAARHLSTVFREQVVESDVLRLALDRHLALSVNFVNHATAKRCRIVPLDIAETWTVSFLEELFNRGVKPKVAPTKDYKLLKGFYLGDNRVLEVETAIVTLDGVYDLPMIGGEALDVEHEYQRLTGGPEVTLTNLEGAFVQKGELTIFQLQESFEENEFKRGSLAALRNLKDRIAVEGLNQQEADRLLAQHAEERREYLARKKPGLDDHYPAGGLPADAVLVVRTKALRELQERVESEGEGKKLEIGLRAETTYQNIIGGLLKLILGTTPGGKPQSVFVDQAAVIEVLLATHGNKPGISRRTLEQKFAAAKRSLDAS